MNCDVAEDVTIAVNSTKHIGTTSNPSNSLPLFGGILCAKASMLLQVSYEIVTVRVVLIRSWKIIKIILIFMRSLK